MSLGWAPWKSVKPAPAPKSRRPRVGIVEDDDDFRALVHGWLLERYEAHAYSSAEDLLARFSKAPLDLVLIDIGLPGLDGLGLAEILAASGHPVAVVMLTASRTNRDFVRSLETGRAAFLGKPITRVELLRAVGKALAGPPTDEP